MGDFHNQILGEQAHRPWPMPAGPWVMTQTWHDLLFAHWRVDPAVLAGKLPAGLELDLFEGEAWVAVVPFRMTNVGLRFMPLLPGASAFPELNVRTYVRGGSKPGVYFFSLDAASLMAVRVARRLFHLPYFHASMRVERIDDSIEYSSRRRGAAGERAELVARYEPIGRAFTPIPGTREHFLTERYRLYTTGAQGDLRHVDIHHPAWRLRVARADFHTNTMLTACGLAVDDPAPLLHFSWRQDVVTWGLRSSARDR